MALSCEEKVLRALKKAAPKAAKLLCECLGDEQLPFKQRYDAAIEVLTRLFGKANADSGDCGRLEVVFKNEAEDYAK